MKLSSDVENKLEEAISLWADEVLPGKPLLLAVAVYTSMLQLLQKMTDDINDRFKEGKGHE